MSRNRRNRGVQSGDPFSSFEPNAQPAPGGDLTDMSTSQFASAGYNSQIGDFEIVGRGKVTAKPLDIDKIYPDPAQPRRTIPSRLRKLYWNGRPDAPSMAFLFEKWLEEIKVENEGSGFDLEGILLGESTARARVEEGSEEDPAATEDMPRAGQYEEALLKIADLAGSIRRDGLTNPITLVPQENNTFTIETGERRWMAYQLLRWHSQGDAAWSKIPAREVDSINIWRQASENNARADLTGIARARQLALLVMDLYRDETHFVPFEDFEQEQAFYAQVADGGLFKVPPEKRERVLNAMGFRHPVQIRQYRALLRLPAKVWTLADDFSWTENAIQKDLLQKSNGDTDLLVRLAQQKAGEVSEDVVSALTRDDVAGEPAPKSGKKSVRVARWRKDFSRLRKELDTMFIHERDELLAELEAILNQFRRDR